jgi:hypothetical protein
MIQPWSKEARQKLAKELGCPWVLISRNTSKSGKNERIYRVAKSHGDIWEEYQGGYLHSTKWRIEK